MSSRNYTWVNNQEDLIMSKADRVFCSTEFDNLCPLASATVLPRVGSDHTPIVLCGILELGKTLENLALNLKNGGRLDLTLRI